MWCLSLDIAESKSQSLLATAVGRNERHVRGQLRFRSSGAMRVEMQETTSPIQDRASAQSINARAVGTYPEHRLLHELSDRELIAAAAHHLQVLLLHEERCSLREVSTAGSQEGPKGSKRVFSECFQGEFYLSPILRR